MHGLSASHARVRPVVLIAVLALVAALVPIVPVAAAPAGVQEVPEGITIYVDNSVDGPGTGTAADPFELLGDGLAAASAGDTVMVAPGEYGPHTGETLPFVVPSDVSVIGTYADDIGWQTVLSGGPWMIESAAQNGLDTQIMVLGDRMDTIDARVTEVVGEGVEGVTLANLIFANNVFGDAGAGLGVYNSQVDIDNCVFTELIAFLGSAIDAHNSDVSVSRSVFVGNGGGTAAPFSAQQEIPFDIDMGSLRLDQIPAGADGTSAQISEAAQYGGAIWSVDTDLDMRDSVLYANYAYTSGGAILIDGGTCTTADSVFFFNATEGDYINSAEFKGAELDDYAGTLASQFLEPFGGGAVSNLTGTYIAKRSYFVLNLSDPGAAVMTQAGSTKLDQCGIGMNYGAAVVSVGEGLLSGSADAEYQAAGALPEPTDYPSGLDIDRCQIIVNDGFFTVYSESHPTRVTNSLFADNWAVAVVAIESGVDANDVALQPEISIDSSVEGCTFVDNSVEYAAIVGPIQDYTPVVNTILWNNDEWDPLADASNVDAFNVCYENELDSGFEVDCSTDDPMLTEDYELAPDSPCIDAGTSSPEYAETFAAEAALAWDLRPWDILNVGRPLDGDSDGEALYDIGAFEFLPSGRVSGLDRFATSVAVSKQHFGTADTVVIATGREFADGLSGSGLAGVYYAPILLTEPGVLPADVAAEITRLGATRAFILGGPVAVGPAVESALVGLGLAVERIGGIDRYETAALIADHVMERRDGLMFFAAPVSVAFIARGDLFADALAVAPIAYANRMPVLLVQPDALPAHTVDVLGEYGITSAVVLGGDIAVSGAVAAEVAALEDVTVTRIDGASRYETAANIAEWAWENYLADFRTTGVATGDDFADALSGGAGIGSMNGVLLLNPSGTVHPACKASIEDHAEEIEALVTFGGPNALSESVYVYLMGLLAP